MFSSGPFVPAGLKQKLMIPRPHLLFSFINDNIVQSRKLEVIFELVPFILFSNEIPAHSLTQDNALSKVNKIMRSQTISKWFPKYL